MAAADYRLCDVCGSKTFYDANLNYYQGADVEGSVRNSGVLLQHTRLDYLGDWCVICQECAKTHECQVAQKDATAAVDEMLTPTGTFCSVCEAPQHNTPSGVSCPRGHGGAEPLASQPAAEDDAWRQKAAEWLEAKAVEQEANNQRWSDHAAVYKEWRDCPNLLRMLAAQVLAAQPGEQQPTAENGEVSFEIHAGGEYFATVFGQREQAWKEAMHYVSQMSPEDGEPEVFEVTRRKVTLERYDK